MQNATLVRVAPEKYLTEIGPLIFEKVWSSFNPFVIIFDFLDKILYFLGYLCMIVRTGLHNTKSVGEGVTVSEVHEHVLDLSICISV